MADLTNAERETHISMTADDRSKWTIGSDDPVMQRRFEAIGATLTRTRGDWREYTLPVGQISLRNPAKPLSEERRVELATRMRALHSAKVITGAENRSEAASEVAVLE